MNEQNIESVIEKLKALRMKTAAEHLVRVLQRAETQNLPPLMIIEALVDIEEEMRQKNRILRRFKQSRLLEKPTIDQFDFHFHISRQKQKTKILNLMDMTFISPKKDVLFIGNTGVGKSFLAKSIAFAATQRGVKTLFTSAMDMINLLTAADVDRSLFKKLRDYQAPDLLVIDEVGYLPLGAQGSNLFFQIISARHQKKSTVITSNLIFAEWGNIFDNTTVATAIADRLVHNSEVIIMEGPSYRTKNKS
jgi:DNA replication protein DnaC